MPTYADAYQSQLGVTPGLDPNMYKVSNVINGKAYNPGGDLLGDAGSYNVGDTYGQNNKLSGGTTTAKAPVDLSLFDQNANELQALLGRTDTQLNQGIQRNEDAYNTNVGTATTQKDQKVVSENKNKASAYDTIRNNAGTGYRSLAQIIGRAAGTGSSAFKELLPNVVGKDTSSKIFNAGNTANDNLSAIDTSYNGVLADLLKQKKTNEESIRSTVEGSRQDINSKLSANAIARAQAAGMTPEQAVAAASPFKAAVDSSRNAVESFFNTFRTPYTPQQVTPTLNAYNTDRSAVNASSQGGADPNNPYAALLRKKLTGGA